MPVRLIVSASAPPHASQNLALSRFSLPQRLQSIGLASYARAGFRVDTT